MDIGWLRDLNIIIFGIIFIAAVTAKILVALYLYKRAKVTLAKVETVIGKGDTFSARAEEVLVRPLIQIAAVTQGIYQVIIGIINVFQKKRR